VPKVIPPPEAVQPSKILKATLREEEQEPKPTVTPETVDTHTNTVIHFNNFLSVMLVPGIYIQPSTSGSPAIWQNVTADQWVLEVVRGYKLQLLSTPIQDASPRVIEAKRAHLVSEEVQNLLTKGAIKIVSPCHNQFLSRIFVVPKKDGSHRPVIKPKATGLIYEEHSLQDGESEHDEGLT